ncbi:hypothetical protein ALP10_01903 [Pseudomonas syringae pv. helianthi]|uniref:Shedu protein SduA C-terminal domain-containing protein n=1 Tax=Pseudomonas syringae pv. helianthi TaxID=251654 RepID=A0A3M6CRD8_9PSED|nr:Shedu immune nuclease family protein [Pseudomonas syringae group genomosp. 7]RMV45974.1 hypothetical protein ALP10_01903 [Pseudomonas syringae pv. helianthi]
MEISDERFEEVWGSIQLAQDMRKARPEDYDRLAIALSFKLSHSDFALDPKDSAEHLLKIVQEKIDERLEEILGADRSRENFAKQLELAPGFKFFMDVALRAKRKLNDLIQYIDDDESDEFAIEFAEFVLEAMDEFNSVIVNGDVLPLLKRGVYASDIARALDVWATKRGDEAGNESFWHEELEKRKGVLERLLGGYALFMQSEFHVGTTDVRGAGSKRADFAYLNKANNISLIEIKAPKTKLLGRKYRDTCPFSSEVSGAISQVLIQRNELMANFYQKRHMAPMPFEVFAPRCFLIVGDLSSISDDRDKLMAFEVQRQAISSHVSIVTFDELYDQFSSFHQI